MTKIVYSSRCEVRSILGVTAQMHQSAHRLSLIHKGSFQPPPPHQICMLIEIKSNFAAEPGDIYSGGPMEARNTFEELSILNYSRLMAVPFAL